MPSQLASIPARTRRRAAAVVGLFAALFATVGVLCWVRDTGVALRVIGVIVLVAAVALGLICWGLLSSIRVDRLSDEFDAEIAETIARHDVTCGCGHDHDMAEMTEIAGENPDVGAASAVVGASCIGDGHGQDCVHDCASCTLAAMRK